MKKLLFFLCICLFANISSASTIYCAHDAYCVPWQGKVKCYTSPKNIGFILVISSPIPTPGHYYFTRAFGDHPLCEYAKGDPDKRYPVFIADMPITPDKDAIGNHWNCPPSGVCVCQTSDEHLCPFNGPQ